MIKEWTSGAIRFSKSSEKLMVLSGFSLCLLSQEDGDTQVMIDLPIERGVVALVTLVALLIDEVVGGLPFLEPRYAIQIP